MRGTRALPSSVLGAPALPILFALAFALGLTRTADAQMNPSVQALTHIASLAPGSITGVVEDERGVPVHGAIVSVLGTTTSYAVTDRAGRFELRSLTPGPYLLRAHLSGFVASKGQTIQVQSRLSTSSAIALRHTAAVATVGTIPVATAGFGPSGDSPAMPGPVGPVGTEGESSPRSGSDDHGETAWRLRHARRGILRDVTIPDEILADDAPDTNPFAATTRFSRAVESSARLATNLFAGTPFTGQVNLLTTGSFDAPDQLFATDSLSRGVAYLALSAPVGGADWTMRAALTQGDIASWLLAADYTTRAPARHRLGLGWSYGTQRYDARNAAGLSGLTDASRNARTIYGFDTFALSPTVTVTYGGRFARYDYLAQRDLFSPRVAITVEPIAHTRVSGSVSHRVVAPGAEEFLPQADDGVLLPPQRTFSALDGQRPLQAERTDHVDIGLERDIAAATLSVRAFHQRVADQIVTLFGVDLPEANSHIDHYVLGNAGDVDAAGISLGIRASLAGRVHGAVEYSTAHAQLAGGDQQYLLLFAPSTLRPANRIHDVTTSVATEIPETFTRVVLLYRLSNGFARPSASTVVPDHGTVDARFDVQVHQSLPFMDFSAAKWEMLVSVRNFFRETAPDQSLYDELFVVRPPKRVVGGLSLKF